MAAGSEEAGIVAPKENQWVAGIKLRGHYFTNHDGVITSNMRGVEAARNLA